MEYGRRARQLSALAMISVLSACGSGDGGGPKETPAKVMTPLTMDSAGWGGQPASLRKTSDSDKGDRVMNAVNGFALELVPIITFLNSSANETVSPSALDVDPSACHPANGNVTVSSTVKEDNEQRHVVIHLELDDCRLSTSSHAYRLNGFFDTDQVAQKDDGSIRIAETYDLAGARDGETFTFSGRRSLDISSVDANDQTILTTIPVLELRLGERYSAMRDAVEQVHFWDTEVGLRQEGQVVGSALSGYLNLSTPEPIRWDTTEGCPYHGVIRYEGDGNIEIRYGENTAQPGNVVEVLLNDSVSDTVTECYVSFPVSPV